ncbi:MAG: succinate--CoA ligase subunit alpha [Armatimonadetes bacterium]|nr:succinate--CoA ligase subunit alpha [Armatimonadota bacterium]
MSILVDKNTRLLVQGMTGREGEFHTRQMVAYGTNVVGGVTPGKGGGELNGIPIFDTVAEARRATDANATCIFVPAKFAKDAVVEAVDAQIPLIVTITEGIPALDMVYAVNLVRSRGLRMIGANCPGIITPGECKIGILPGEIFTSGSVGLISRSGTLTYEIVDELTRAGLGQSTCIGIGGDPTPGTTFIDALPLFEADPQTRVVVMVGEIGGADEEIASEYIAKEMSKPVIGFVSGRTAPPGKRMGHAGAIVSGRSGTAQAKVEALLRAGVKVADTTHDIPALVSAALKQEPSVH